MVKNKSDIVKNARFFFCKGQLTTWEACREESKKQEKVYTVGDGKMYLHADADGLGCQEVMLSHGKSKWRLSVFR